MKLSLWQQFSSNHSAHFTVVGSFSTEAQAREAEIQFTTLFQAILDWNAIPEHKVLIEEHKRTSDSAPATPPEIEVAQRYRLELPSQSIDWLSPDLDENVFRVGSDLLVSVDFETWQGPTPIQNLMTAHGGVVKTQQQDEIYLTVHLTCDFVNEDRAQEILQLAGPFLRHPRGKKPLWTWKKEGHGIYGFGQMRAKGQQIIIDHQFFKFHPGFPALLQWLQNAGAENIAYTLTEAQEGSHLL